MKKLKLYLLVILFWPGQVYFAQAQELLNPEEIVLKIGENKENPRNSEGSFIQLKDGRILFVLWQRNGKNYKKIYPWC